MNTLTLPQQEIAVRAYHLYLNAGSSHGNDWGHWFQAEKEIGAKFFTPPPAKSSNARSAITKAPASKVAVKKTPAKKASARKPSVKK